LILAVFWSSERRAANAREMSGFGLSPGPLVGGHVE